jgi:hypothetical protein
MLEGDHAGHIREVPQEEHSPSMYIAHSWTHCKEEIQLTANPMRVLLKKPNIQEITVVTVLMSA